jgi:two-component system cell cycle sensor histidine kinase/response regulator CckA
VVSGLQSLLRRLISEDVEVVLGLDPRPMLVSADRGQIEQIVMNLAVNARDAMPDGGRLTIETAHVELDEHYAATHFSVTPGAYVALTVTDTGVGMTPDVQAHLFEPFFTTKEPGKGTGLGLATVHGVVTRSGGNVGVYSEVGRGTSFKIYLPRADATAAADARPSSPAVPVLGHGRTVLVVDDNEGLRQLMSRTLTRQGFEVLVAADAAEAMQKVDAHASIDVLLTDVVMPCASGPELTLDLQQRRPGLKVIYMSGYTEDAIVHHGVVEEGIAFLQKPITPGALTQKVRAVLDAT